MKKIGIIGFGSIGQRHYNNIRALYPKFQVNILTKRSDIKPDENTAIFASEKKFFAQTNDIFFITNETNKHAQTIAKCLLQNPVGVFVEKPISHNLTGIDKIARMTAKQKTVFFVGYCMQFYPPFVKLKQSLKQIGKPLFIRASVGQDLRTWRARDYRENYSYDSSRGGGVVLDLIHEINYPAWLLGQKILFKTGIVRKLKAFKIESENISESLFQSEKGVIISIHQDYLRNPGRRYCEIVGTKGTLVWDSLGAPKPSKDMHQEELKFFIKKVKKQNGYTNITEAVSDLRNTLALKKTYAKN